MGSKVIPPPSLELGGETKKMEYAPIVTRDYTPITWKLCWQHTYQMLLQVKNGLEDLLGRPELILLHEEEITNKTRL